MRLTTTATDWAIALVAGYFATRVTDRAQSLLWRATPEHEKAREPAGSETSSARSAARLLCVWCGLRPTEPRVRVFKKGLHYGLGLGWGTVYGYSRRRAGARPLLSGVLTGTSLSLIVDEGLNPLLGITPAPRKYPASSHLRGLLAHLVYGLAVACCAEPLYRLEDRLRRR